MTEIRMGWKTLFDTPEIKTVDGKVYSFKKGDLLPSWLYASFPRGIRQKYFIKNNQLLGEVHGAGGTH